MTKTTLSAFLMAFSSFCFAQDKDAIRFSEQVDREDMKKILGYLAGPECQGRETCTPGHKKALDYIAASFKANNVAPAIKGSYLYDVPLIKSPAPSCSFKIKGKSYENGKDFFFFGAYMNDTILKADSTVLLDYSSLENTEKLAEANLKGKVALAFAGKNSSDYTMPATMEMRKKINYLNAQKPKVIFIIVDSMTKEAAKVEAISHADRLALPGDNSMNKMSRLFSSVPVFYISVPMADAILAEKGLSVAKYRARQSNGASDLFKAPCAIEVKRIYTDVKSYNIVGMVEGSDLKNEYVVISAHTDHLGIKGKEVFYGADDDGSGTTAIVEIAQAFGKAKAAGKGPRRTIVFLGCTGEEKGLLGSKYYTDHPYFPLESTVTDLNVDMIGRIDEKHKDNKNFVYIIGSDKLSKDLHQISEMANKNYSNLELDYTYNDPKDQNRFYYRSDHYNFAKHNIPIIFYFNGTHPDYHKSTDTVDKIDFELMEKRARLVFFTAWEIANRTEKPKLDGVNDFENNR